MKIIYKNESGGVSIVVPKNHYTTLDELQQLAEKDVPTGLPYKIAEDSEIPTGRTYREAWTIDDSLLTDGVGADYGVGSANLLIGYDELRNPIVMTQQEYEEYSA